jgi:hypothetical protein
MAAWGDAQDDREVACVGLMLTEACSLGDAPACGYAGRMWLDGRGLAPDVERGLGMVLRACEGGVALACIAGLRWLAEDRREQSVKDGPAFHKRLEDEHSCLTGSAEHCMELGQEFSVGRGLYPKDLVRSGVEYQRGCDLGNGLACSNLGDAYEYGNGVPRDLSRAATLYERACRLGQALGCSNLGHLLKHGEGVTRDVARARVLFRDACAAGDVYGCLHAALLVAAVGRALAARLRRARRPGVRLRGGPLRGRTRRLCARRGEELEGDVARVRSRQPRWLRLAQGPLRPTTVEEAGTGGDTRAGSR